VSTKMQKESIDHFSFHLKRSCKVFQETGKHISSQYFYILQVLSD
jgi:hypothetical protein